MVETLSTLVLIAVLIVIAFKSLRIRRAIIYEYQRGLKYRKGKFQRFSMLDNTDIPTDD